VYVGLGSNLGDRAANLAAARRRLAGVLTGLAASRVYETEPWGYRQQPPFYNQVVRGETAQPPLDLLRALQRLEQELGRVPGPRWGPRLIDLDLLLYGGLRLSLPDLEVPHPHLAQRAFVLVPLAELAPGLAVPGTGRTVGELLDSLPPDERAGVRLLGTERA